MCVNTEYYTVCVLYVYLCVIILQRNTYKQRLLHSMCTLCLLMCKNITKKYV